MRLRHGARHHAFGSGAHRGRIIADLADDPTGARRVRVTATSVNNAAHYIDPATKVFPGYSTTIIKRRNRVYKKNASST